VDEAVREQRVKTRIAKKHFEKIARGGVALEARSPVVGYLGENRIVTHRFVLPSLADFSATRALWKRAPEAPGQQEQQQIEGLAGVTNVITERISIRRRPVLPRERAPDSTGDARCSEQRK
jgi:hypothetical protein